MFNLETVLSFLLLIAFGYIIVFIWQVAVARVKTGKPFGLEDALGIVVVLVGVLLIIQYYPAYLLESVNTGWVNTSEGRAELQQNLRIFLDEIGTGSSDFSLGQPENGGIQGADGLDHFLPSTAIPEPTATPTLEPVEIEPFFTATPAPTLEPTVTPLPTVTATPTMTQHEIDYGAYLPKPPTPYITPRS